MFTVIICYKCILLTEIYSKCQAKGINLRKVLYSTILVKQNKIKPENSYKISLPHQFLNIYSIYIAVLIFDIITTNM